MYPSGNKLLLRLPYIGDPIQYSQICLKGVPTFFEEDRVCHSAGFGDQQALQADCSGYCDSSSTAIGTCGYPNHLDVGSRVDGLVAHIASFRELDFLDICVETKIRLGAGV